MNCFSMRLLCLLLAWLQAPILSAAVAPLLQPAAFAETAPVPNDGDAADDPAIWIHPTSPELSLILGTDKADGLHIYNLDGTRREIISRGSKPNNVDVLYGFKLGGQIVDLAVMTTRAGKARGLQIFSIDPATRQFSNVIAGGTWPVLLNNEPYGCGAYKSRTGAAHVFVTSKEGAIEQYTLHATDDRHVRAEKVATFNLGSTVEGCVVDEETGAVYFGEETVGIWKTSAEPSPTNKLSLIAKVGENGLSADVEGLAIYYARDGAGYLVASSQGNNTYKVYERGGENRFVTTINPVAGKFGDVEDTDGIAVTSYSLPPLFPNGLLIVQDGKNQPRTQNFKMFRWEEVAGTNLLIRGAATRR